MAAKLLLKMGLQKTIQLGLNTNVWTEPWIQDTSSCPPKMVVHITFAKIKIGHEGINA